MKHPCRFSFLHAFALLLGLASCTKPGAAAQPGWALGEQPNFSGTLQDWALGDAIASGEGAIFAKTGSPDSFEEVDVGTGSVKADGSFTFGLQKGAGAAGGGQQPGQALCADFSVVELVLSNPQQRIVGVSDLEVPALYAEGKHARPLGGIRIRSTPPSAGSLLEGYNFTYASADGTIKGSCSAEGLSVSFDLDLRKGWNSVLLEAGRGLKFTTAAIPQGTKWYFVNPLTVNQ